MKIRLARKVLHRYWYRLRDYRGSTYQRATRRQHKWERELRATYGIGLVARGVMSFRQFVDFNDQQMRAALNLGPRLLDPRVIINGRNA